MSTTPAPESELASAANFTSISARVWRVVEGQRRISSARLIDNADELALLERLVEEVKPPFPPAARRLHELLGTPFRYGYGRESRFRRSQERPGVFYASEAECTAIAEMAWWRLRVFAAAPGMTLPKTNMEHTSFSVTLSCDRALDLTGPPYAAARKAWTDAGDYSACQQFAAAARALGTQAIRYESVRDPAAGRNIALLDPACFGEPVPRIERHWHFRFDRGRLRAFAAYPFIEQHSFTFEQFGLEAPTAGARAEP